MNRKKWMETQSFPGFSPANGINSGFWGNFILPFLLSVLPALILIQDLQHGRQAMEDSRQIESLEKKRNLIQRVQEITSNQFWIEETSRRIKGRVERKLNGPGVDDAGLSRLFQRAVSQPLFSGVPPMRIWAMGFPKGDPNSGKNFLQGSGLENSSKFAFIPLLRQFGRGSRNLPPEIDAKTWLNRLRGTFGDAVSPDLFSDDYRGRAFHVIFQGGFGLAAWDLITVESRPLAAYFVFLPLTPKEKRLALRSSLLNWRLVSGTDENLPIFFPILKSPKSVRNPVLLHRPTLSSPFRRLIRQTREQIGCLSGNEIKKFSRLNLPYLSLNRLDRSGEWEGLIFPLTHQPGYLGMLVSRIVPSSGAFLERFTGWYLGFVALFWGLVFLLKATGRPLQSPGIQAELTLWFLGIIATPIALTLGAGDRLARDIASNQEERLQRELRNQFRHIESGGSRVDAISRRISRGILDSAGFKNLLKDLPQGESRMKEWVWKEFKNSGMELTAFILFGPNQSAVSVFHPSISSETASIALEFDHQTTLSRMEKVSSMSGSEMRPKNPKRLILGEVIEKNKGIIQGPGSVMQFEIGNKHTLQSFDQISIPNGDQFNLFLIWNQEQFYRRYLENVVREINARHSGIFAGAFGKKGGTLEFLSGGGSPKDLEFLRRNIESYDFQEKIDGFLLMGQDSGKMPGFFLAVGTSLAPMEEVIKHESRRFMLCLGLMTVFVLIGGYILSLRLTKPVLRMIDGLLQVSKGNFFVTLGEARLDELGAAGATLDRMTGWLRERDVMSRFVSPQVLDVVAQGNLEQATQPQKREVTLLVSDVRQFTTLSERYPPPEIFSLINHHLKQMTPIIQKHGGVIDRFIGDAIQAVFYPGGKIPMEQRALAAAREMMAEHGNINEIRGQNGTFSYRIGIGVEVGEVVTGVVGARNERLDFSVIGEAFKHAADLEAASKFGKETLIMCSDKVKNRTGSNFSFTRAQSWDENAIWELCGETRGPPEKSTREALHGGIEGPIASASQIPESVSKTSIQTTDAVSELTHGSPESSDHRHSTPLSGDREIRTLHWCILVAVFLPFLFLGILFHALIQGDRLLARQEALKKLEADADIISKLSAPRFHLAYSLRTKLHQVFQRIRERKTPASSWAGEFREALQPYLQTMPGLEYCLFRNNFPFVNTLQYSLPANPILFRQGRFCGFMDGFLSKWFYLSKMDILGYSIPDELKPDIAILEGRLGVGNIGDLISKTLGNFAEIFSGAERRFFFWMPFFSPSMFETSDFQPLTVKEMSSFRESQLRDIKGGIFIMVPIPEVTSIVGESCLLERLKESACEVAVIPETFPREGGYTPKKPWMEYLLGGSPPNAPSMRFSEGFNQQPLSDFLTSYLKNSGSLPIPPPEWEILPVYPDQASGSHFLLARAHAPQSQTLVFGRNILCIIGVIWILGGLWIARFFLSAGNTFHIPLTVQMSGAFCLTILPAVILGSISLERSRVEETTRWRKDHEKRLYDHLQVLNYSRQLFSGFLGGVLDTLLEDPRFGRTLQKLEKLYFTRKSVNQDSWKEFFRFMNRYGFKFESATVFGLGGFFKTLFHDRSGEYRIQKAFFSLLSRVFQAVNPDITNVSSRASKEVIGVKALAGEELKNILSAVIPPEKFAETIQSPLSFMRVLLDDGNQYFFRKFMYFSERPRYIFLALIKPAMIDYQVFNAWRRLYHRPDFRECEFSIASKEKPARFFHPPYYFPVLEKKRGLKLDEVFCPQPHLRGELSTLAFQTNSAVSTEIGSGSDLRLCMAFSPTDTGDLIFSATVPIGREMALENRAANIHRLSLFGIFILTIIMAVLTSRRFLDPLMELSNAARSIMGKDFSARLSTGAGGEFGLLATAFNKMAGEVEEGRLLSRFVSESVKAAAKDSQLEKRAREGIQTHAAILFAGISGFPKAMRTYSPEELVKRLNEFHERMTSIIRENGGDIDKFIGDKILAVFHDRSSEQGGLGASARSAFQAAESMRETMPDLSIGNEFPVGIGLATGPLLAGIMGTPEVRLELTVIGDTVNLAARLCELAQKLDRNGNIVEIGEVSGGILLDAFTREKLLETLQETLLEKTALPPIKGKTRAVEVFRPIARDC